MCLVGLLMANELGFVHNGAQYVHTEPIGVNTFLNLASACSGFSHRGHAHSRFVAHTDGDVRASQESPSLQNGWRRKAGWGGPCCCLSCCSGPHRWTGNRTGCWELLPSLALNGGGTLPSLLLRSSTPGTPLPSRASCSKFRAGRASLQQPSSHCVSLLRPLTPKPDPGFLRARPHACRTNLLPCSRFPTIKGHKELLFLWSGEPNTGLMSGFIRLFLMRDHTPGQPSCHSY